ncbi:DNA primase TraC [Vibrio cholerae]|nr:DNA primase TraC [Vibrio cholerae]
MAYQKGKYKNTKYKSNKKKSSKTMAEKQKESNELVVNSILKFFEGADTDFKEDEHNQDVQFFNTSLKALPRNFNDQNYKGVNILMLLETQEKRDVKIPIYTTHNQVKQIIADNKDNFPPKSDDFDPEKPFAGLKAEAQVVKYLKSYYKDGEAITEKEFNDETDGMTYAEMRENGYSFKKGIIPYSVIPLERFEHLLPKGFLDKYEYTAKQKELDEKLRMNPDFENEYFLNETKILIDAMRDDGLTITEKDIGRAYYNYVDDEVVIPPRHRFNSDMSYYSVIRHECTHATGSKKRLDRETKNDAFGNIFGSPLYAREEVVAELGTSFECLDKGAKTFFAHAKYIKSWANATAEENSKLLIEAVNDAQKAQQYLSERVLIRKLKIGLIVEKELKEEEPKKKAKAKAKVKP